MKVVFKVCCANDEQQQHHQNITSLVPSTSTTTANNNIPEQQQPPQQHSTGISINQSKTKTPMFAQQVPQSGVGGSQQNGGVGSSGTSINSGRFVPAINTNTSNIVQSTMNWPQQTPNNNNYYHQQPFNPSYATSPRTPLNSANNYNNNNSPSTSQTSLSNSHKPTKKTSKFLPYVPSSFLFIYLFLIQLV